MTLAGHWSHGSGRAPQRRSPTCVRERAPRRAPSLAVRGRAAPRAARCKRGTVATNAPRRRAAPRASAAGGSDRLAVVAAAAAGRGRSCAGSSSGRLDGGTFRVLPRECKLLVSTGPGTCSRRGSAWTAPASCRPSSICCPPPWRTRPRYRSCSPLSVALGSAASRRSGHRRLRGSRHHQPECSRCREPVLECGGPSGCPDAVWRPQPAGHRGSATTTGSSASA